MTNEYEKKYVEVFELDGPERKFDKIFVDGQEIKLDSCCAGGLNRFGDLACLNFVCHVGKKKFFVWCEDTLDGYRYFIFRKKKASS